MTLKSPTPRIAIPMPHSGDSDYAERAFPQYENAVKRAGGDPVPIDLHLPPVDVKKLIESCDAILLPGSRADVDPKKYNAPRHEKTADADEKRDAVDRLLLSDAYQKRKPVLGICYGLQSLNVFRAGTLLQHIESHDQAQRRANGGECTHGRNRSQLKIGGDHRRCEKNQSR